MDTARYAICFAPEQGSALELFSHEWFGKDGAFSKASASIPGISVNRFLELTEGPRNYGMHGTLKPSFELVSHTTESNLLESAEIVAKRLKPVVLPPMELGEVANIVALVLRASTAPLEMFAALCVRSFDGYRRHLTPEEEDHFRRNRLTVHQEQMLEHWGYPYVMEEFDFHISVTDPVANRKERAAMLKALRKIAAPVLGKSIEIRELCIFSQRSAKHPMTIIARIPFGHRA